MCKREFAAEVRQFGGLFFSGKTARHYPLAQAYCRGAEIGADSAEGLGCEEV